MSELISVIVPVYNMEKYLAKCVESVISQTYKNLEIILVDDGSKDKSGKLCDEYALRDSRIKVIHQENQGLSAARNNALEIINGQYIFLLDSDDYMPLDACQVMLDSMGDADLVQGLMYGVTRLHTIKNAKFQDMIEIESPDKILDCYYSNQGIIAPTACGKLYKASLFDDIRFPVGRIYEDASVMYKILNKSKKIRIIPDFIYYCRDNEKSITHTKNKKYYIDQILCCREEAKYFSELNNKSDEKLYTRLYDRYICIYVELAAFNNSELMNEVVSMLKEDMNENTDCLEKEKLELLQEIAGQKELDRIKKYIVEFRKQMHKKNTKAILKRIISIFIKNKDF